MDVLYGMILKRFSLATTKRRNYGDVLVGQILYIILNKALTEESLFPFMYGNGYLWTRLRSSTGAVQISIASPPQKKNEDPKTLEHLMLRRHVSMSRYVISKRQQDFREYILARYTENRWVSWLFGNVREERSYVV